MRKLSKRAWRKALHGFKIQASKEGGIEAFIRAYLRPSHREHPEKGCPAAALGPEIGRHSKATRSAFTRKLRRMVSHIDSLLPNPNVEIAQAIFATLVGTMQLPAPFPIPLFPTSCSKPDKRLPCRLRTRRNRKETDDGDFVRACCYAEAAWRKLFACRSVVNNVPVSNVGKKGEARSDDGASEIR